MTITNNHDKLKKSPLVQFLLEQEECIKKIKNNSDSIEKIIQQLSQCKDTTITLPASNNADYIQNTAIEIRKSELQMLNNNFENLIQNITNPETLSQIINSDPSLNQLINNLRQQLQIETGKKFVLRKN